MLIAFAVYGIVTMEILFSLDLYVRPDWRIYEYRKIIWDNFPVSLNTITNVRTYEHEKSLGIPIPGVVESYDNYKPISIEENQLAQLMLDEKLQRCEPCADKWFVPNSLLSWMHEFRSWVDKGACDLLPDGIDPFIKTIPR